VVQGGIATKAIFFFFFAKLTSDTGALKHAPMALSQTLRLLPWVVREDNKEAGFKHGGDWAHFWTEDRVSNKRPTPRFHRLMGVRGK
jgi:hypothetical protein